MTMVQITAIIATGILGVLCIICIASVLRNERQTNENSRAIRDIEKSLNSFGDSIKEQTEQLIEHMEKQQPDEASERRLELLEEEIRQLTRLEEEAAAAAEALAAAEAEGDIAEIEEIGEIEELDDEIELDDLFRELNAMTAESGPEPAPQLQPEPAAQPAEPETAPEEPPAPTRYHQGYNIGRSGRKYTAEELNVLIRE